MKKIDVVIIDDEGVNVKLLEHLLTKYCSLANIVGTANSKSEAVTLINKLKPQLIFLDIIMNDGTGFDVIEEIDHDESKIIFVTDSVEYAFKAFKCCNVIDYVLKPVKIEELIVAFNKAHKDIKEEFLTTQEPSSSNPISNQYPLNFIAISSLDKIELIKLEDITFLKSYGRYTEFNLSNGNKLVACRNIGEYECLIDETHFFRIHNSYMVNLNHVININKADGSHCEMINKVSLPISKRRKEEFHRFLKIK